MKVLSYILLILVLATSLFPCCVPSISKNTISSSFQDDCCKHLPSDKTEDSEDKQEQKESCSPFFTCGACSGFSLTSKQIVFIEASALSTQHNNYYQVRFFSDYFNKKWQPPKIV